MKKVVVLTIIILVAVMITSCKDTVVPHEHKFADTWSKNSTHHWKVAICEHTEEVSDKTAHSFDEWTTTKEATEEDVGSKERVCSVCKYKETVEIEKLEHTHKFANTWSKNSTHHWKVATCEHTEEVSKFAKHTFCEYVSNHDATTESDGTKTRICRVCLYEDTVIDEGTKIEVPEGFVLIPAGTFQMGSTVGNGHVKPVHEVIITKDFFMGKYEVSQAEYEKYCTYSESKSPSSDYGVGDNYPAYYVSWYDVLVYCNNRSIAEGLTPCYSISGNVDPSKWGTVPSSINKTWDAVVCDWEANGYRLPTEAEWEYAARAGDNTVSSKTYAGTSDESKLSEYAWYKDNSGNKIHPVGSKKPNAFGLYDMSGSLWEWCWNWKTSSYNIETEGGSDPTGGVPMDNTRVNRGGGWSSYSDSCTVSIRFSNSINFPYNSYFNLGLRLVRACSK